MISSKTQTPWLRSFLLLCIYVCSSVGLVTLSAALENQRPNTQAPDEFVQTNALQSNQKPFNYSEENEKQLESEIDRILSAEADAVRQARGPSRHQGTYLSQQFTEKQPRPCNSEDPRQSQITQSTQKLQEQQPILEDDIQEILEEEFEEMPREESHQWIKKHEQMSDIQQPNEPEYAYNVSVISLAPASDPQDFPLANAVEEEFIAQDAIPIFAPRHFRFSDPKGGRALDVYFHNEFSPYDMLPCTSLTAFPSLCVDHPRCRVATMDGEKVCSLDPSFLSLFAYTPEMCTSTDNRVRVRGESLNSLGFDLLESVGADGEGVLKNVREEFSHLNTEDAEVEVCLFLQSLSKEINRESNVNVEFNSDDIQEEEQPQNEASSFENLIESALGFISPTPNVHTVVPPFGHTQTPKLRSTRAHTPSSAQGAPSTISLSALSSVGDAQNIRIGINGFGRIGRLVFKIAMERPDVVVKHINCSMEPEYLAYMLKYDSVHGRYPGTITTGKNSIFVDGREVTLSNARDPSEISWASKGVDFVCESTGVFLTTEQALKHVDRADGARHVVISAPAKDELTPTLVVGVNAEKDYRSHMKVVSCASCTTNALAPLVKVIDENFGLTEGLMTTVHAATGTQKVVDGSSKKDWRGGRAASANIIPSSTGAAKAVAKCMPHMKGKLTGMAFRVPTIDVSVVDLTCKLQKSASYDEIKEAVKIASQTYLKGIVGYTEDAVVSQDIVGSECSTIFDSNAGISLNPNFVKLVSWYDNEFAYSARLVDLIALMAHKDGLVAEGTGLNRKEF